MKYASLILLWFLISCSGKNTEQLTPQDFASLIKETPESIIVDVRTPEEVNEGIIENAVNLMYDPSFESKIGGLEHKPIFVYCASGKRSAKAAKILRDNGYAPVYELQGGLNNWIEAGLPVTSPKH